MALNLVGARKFCRLYRPLCQNLVVKQRAESSSHTALQAKCKKIGAVITKQDGQDKSPIVALLGWNSAQDKHLAKYSEIFEKKGFDTIRISANPVNTFMRLSKVKEISLQMLDILEEMDSGQKRPFIFYVFSMGGFNTLFFINEAMSLPGQQHSDALNVVGTIFDSCPHFPGLHSIVGVQRTVLEAMEKVNPLLKAPLWFGLGIFGFPVFLLHPTIKRLIPESIATPVRAPELFLFCRTDDLVDNKDVEIFIDERKKRGATVFSKCWDKSDHVQHFRNYPEEYLREVNNFTDYCLLQHDKHKKHVTSKL